MADKTQKRRAGFYFLDDVGPMVSVTHALKIIDKPAIKHWYGKMVYLAMAKNPSLNQKEALAMPYKKSKTAMKRGKDVHDMVEHYKKGAKLPEEFVGEGEFVGYANAFISFLEDHPNFMPVDHEKTVVNASKGYAGTLDLLAKIGNRTCIIDVKTNADANIYDEVELQLSAYKYALAQENSNAMNYPMFGLALGESGQYTFKQVEDEFDAFIATLRLWIWKHKKTCDAVDYQIKV